MVAVLPEPPLLVPELATGAAAETAQLRAACLAAVARLAAAAPRWIAVGADAGGRRTVPPSARGSFIGFGVDVGAALDTTGTGAADPTDPHLPLPLLVAGWAAGQVRARVRIRGELVAPDAPPAACAAVGADLAAECAADQGSVALLVLGDGAATHTERAPGHLDERAAPFDAAASAALRDADAAALAALDPDLAVDLLVAGRAPWQVLAGAAVGRGWRGELLHSSAPFGVAYHVAVWTPR
ncbi:hypothetical protein [Pseudonocardia lacus]|uniref:hypothetical protein n=1 Tax=Pseudonocardia lacus TaxID=2835865 RepID=UPI002029088B|nr:hypothetical protein [Pseudonocardia lacus]